VGDSAPEVLGFQAFAQRIMRAPSYVTQLRKAGRLVLSADGKGVLVAESIKLIADTSDPSRAGVQARHAAQREAGGATATPPPATGRHGGEAHDPAPFGDDPHSKRRSKALADKAEADARKALRDEQAELGELLRRADVVTVVAEAVALLRSALENLPSQVAAELAATDDEGRVRVTLTEAIESRLGDLARRAGAIGRAA